MARNIALLAALALGVVLATGGIATAQDGTPGKSGISGMTMTLGGKGTAAQAAAADDTELTWCHRRWCGWGGCGWGGCGWGGCGWRGCGWGGYCSYAPVYYAPPVYSVSYYTPFCYRSYPTLYGGFGYGNYIGINGTEKDASAPAVSLNAAVAKSPVVTPRAGDMGGGFRYDGGPANPIPQPKPDAVPSTQAAPAAGLPVSLSKPAAKPASPYTYKAYGEK